MPVSAGRGAASPQTGHVGLSMAVPSTTSCERWLMRSRPKCQGPLQASTMAALETSVAVRAT